MELRLILAAIRRSRLIILVTVLECTVPAFALWATRSSTFEAKTVLYIQPPGSQGNGNINYNDPDRYVISQISVLESSALANAVAKRLKSPDAKSIRQSVTFSHAPKTDLVTITARHANGETARAIANSYADLYINEQVAAVKKSQEPAFTALEKRLETISEGLADADQKLNANPTDSLALVSRDALLSEYGEVVRAKTNLQFLSRVDARSSVLDRASTAFETASTSLPLQLAAGLLVGLALGTAIALAIMVFSSSVSDSGQVEELLGTSPVGPIKSASGFPAAMADVLARTNTPFAATARSVAIRAEAVASPGSPTLTVAVTSPFARSGTTSLATAIAGYFARSSGQTLLIDANDASPTLTEEFAAPDGEKFVRHVDDAITRQSPIELSLLHRSLVSTPTDNLRVFGGIARGLHRGNLATVLKGFRSVANVTVIDCPPTENSPTSVRLAPSVDVIVYLIPVNKLRVSDLRSNIAQFGETPVVVVITTVGARQFFFG